MSYHDFSSDADDEEQVEVDVPSESQTRQRWAVVVLNSSMAIFFLM